MYINDQTIFGHSIVSKNVRENTLKSKLRYIDIECIIVYNYTCTN